MNTLELLRKMESLCDVECGVDDIAEHDYIAYCKHRENCPNCNARESLNEIGDTLRQFNKKFNIVQE